MSAAATLSDYQRDRQTARTVGGVRLQAGRWASGTVHAFWLWVGDTTIRTWCDVEAELLQDGARQTTDLISCLQCGQASWLAISDHATQAEAETDGGAKR